jgi:hypothetical protein
MVAERSQKALMRNIKPGHDRYLKSQDEELARGASRRWRDEMGFAMQRPTAVSIVAAGARPRPITFAFLRI